MGALTSSNVSGVLRLTVASASGMGSPFLVQTTVGQGLAVTLTERRTGALSAWMKENPTHESGGTLKLVTIIGATVGEEKHMMYIVVPKVVATQVLDSVTSQIHCRPLTSITDYEVPTEAI